MSTSTTPVAESRDAFAAALETQLVERCRAGDLTAFDKLSSAHQDRIFNLCYWLLGNRDDAADATQEAFVRAFRSLGNFRGESQFGTWLHRIAVNTSLDVIQRRKRAPLPYSDLSSCEDKAGRSHDDEDVQARYGEEESTLANDPARLSTQRERRHAVQNALADLPEHYRLALVLFDIEGHSYDEIAQTLRLPLGTVKSRINRARLALRDRLQSVRELFVDDCSQ
jgi:RNA polymerase sigma-70 factor (ECF subfamily)